VAVAAACVGVSQESPSLAGLENSSPRLCMDHQTAASLENWTVPLAVLHHGNCQDLDPLVDLASDWLFLGLGLPWQNQGPRFHSLADAGRHLACALVAFLLLPLVVVLHQNGPADLHLESYWEAFAEVVAAHHPSLSCWAVVLLAWREEIDLHPVRLETVALRVGLPCVLAVVELLEAAAALRIAGCRVVADS